MLQDAKVEEQASPHGGTKRAASTDDAQSAPADEDVAAEGSLEDANPMLVDPEFYADHAFVVNVSAKLVGDYEISHNHGVWASTKGKQEKIFKAWQDYTGKRRKTPPLLVAASYPPEGNGAKFVHGLMIMTGLPDPEAVERKRQLAMRKRMFERTGEERHRLSEEEEVELRGIWLEPRWGDDFPITWLIYCPDVKNLMRTSYDLSAKTDMAELPPGLAALTIQELKTFMNRENNPYLRKYSGQFIYRRIAEIFAEGGTAPSRPKRQRPHVKIEYDEKPSTPPSPKKTDVLAATPPIDKVLDPGLCEMVDIEKIFGRKGPSPDEWDPTLTDLSFQVIDQDYCDLPSMHAGDIIMEYFVSPVAPVMRLYGATKEGHSVVAQLRGFSPYFFVRVPEEIVELFKYKRYDAEVKAQLDAEAKAALGREDYYDDATLLGQIASQRPVRAACEKFRSTLSKALVNSFDFSAARRYGYAASMEVGAPAAPPTTEPVLKVLLVRRESMVGHEPYLDWFFRITVISPHFVKPCRTILEAGTFRWFEYDPTHPEINVKPRAYQVFEANIPFALRYMIDIGQMGCCWVTIPKGRYVRWACAEKDRATYADIEVLCHDTDVVAHSTDDPKWTGHAPVRSMTFDIECDGRDGRFPRPDIYDGDPVICISCHVSEEVPEQEKQLVGRILFSWGLCAETGVSHMLCYYKRRGEEALASVRDDLLGAEASYRRCGVSRLKDNTVAYWTPRDEATMLVQWRDFMIRVARPHVLSGYNANNFDMPYLLKRAAALGLGEEFDCLGWIKGQRSRIKTRIFSSKAFGSRTNHEINISGRVFVDCLHLIQRQFKQRSYTLNGSSERHLGTDKNGLPKYTKAEMVRHNLFIALSFFSISPPLART